MKSNTCGECQWYDYHHLLCVVGGDVAPTACACDSFIGIKPTNGDRIRQSNNRKLAHLFAYPCPPGVEKTCNGNDRVECESCWLAYLNAPAESDGKDAQ